MRFQNNKLRTMNQKELQAEWMQSGNVLKRVTWSDGWAAVGLLVWLLFMWLSPRTSEGLLQTIENLLALATLVHLPLAIGLLYRPGDPIWGGDLLHFAQRFQPLAAGAVLISLWLPRGLLAGLFVLPWLAITVSMAFSALSWLFHNRWQANHQLLFCAGMLYLPIGAGWLALYRLGVRPLGFADVIVLLTGVHFHYIGFVLPIIAGTVGRWLRAGDLRSPLYPWLAAGIIVSTPLIAAGITLSPMVEILGVVLLLASVVGLATVLATQVIAHLTVRLVRELLALSMVSLLMAISLGVVYGLGEFLGQQWITIPQMVTFHGWLNGVGFALCGLLGWRLIFPPAVSDGTALLEQEW